MKCPICQWVGSDFLSKNGRNSVLCPQCGAFERHRHQYLVFKKIGLYRTFAKQSVLHFAPEACISNFLTLSKLYVTFDLIYGKAQIQGNIVNLPFQAESFDLIWNSHILEHIQSPEQAIREMQRVLKKKGVAIIDVPIYGNTTIAFNSPQKHGHLWAPGYDWFRKYKKAGLFVELFHSGMFSNNFGINKTSIIAVCKKSTKQS